MAYKASCNSGYFSGLLDGREMSLIWHNAELTLRYYVYELL